MSSDLSIDFRYDSSFELCLAPPLNRSDWNGSNITWRDMPEVRSEIERRIVDIYNAGNQTLAHQLAAFYLEQTKPLYEIRQIKRSKRPDIFESGLPVALIFKEAAEEATLRMRHLLYQAGLSKEPSPPPEPISPTNFPNLWAWKTYCAEYKFSVSEPKNHSSGFKEFWREHKKAIIVAAVVIAVAATVAIVIVTTAGTGTSVAVATGAAAVQAAIDGYDSPENSEPTLEVQREPEIDKRIQNFTEAIGASSVNHSNTQIPIIETNSISPEVTPEALSHLVTNWNAHLTPSTPIHEGPLFLKEGIVFNGQQYSYWDFFQKSKQESFLTNFTNSPKPVVDSQPLSAPTAIPNNSPPYQPIPPQTGSSFTRRFFEMLGREILGPEIVGDTSISDLQKSHLFTTDGERPSSCRIGGINGINTSVEHAVGHADYIAQFTSGQSIDWVYNNSHGVIGDLTEVFTQNYLGKSPNTAKLLTDNWVAFHEENKHNPKARYLQLCHSQGAIHVRNALLNAPKEIRERVMVIAIAPGAIVPDDLCFRSFNYASKKDIVPFGELIFTSLDTNEQERSPSFKAALEHQEQLILLDPHPDATGIDHDFRSPTFKGTLTDLIEDYYKSSGEYE